MCPPRRCSTFKQTYSAFLCADRGTYGARTVLIKYPALTKNSALAIPKDLKTEQTSEILRHYHSFRVPRSPHHRRLLRNISCISQYLFILAVLRSRQRTKDTCPLTTISSTASLIAEWPLTLSEKQLSARIDCYREIMRNIGIPRYLSSGYRALILLPSVLKPSSTSTQMG
ncbi:hypothetical protein SISSUDRAFT_70866 [Sistotremastrum suecicum HHB10207 ss-3]|uniref:Uncharacterized protein n=1 Tax=Sistotremastrum suecicum HHB10207 ss-3 TaxID=1314776 RepID=A0A166BHI6_9AGAM|nr:hypothetical protein SISSUDRAFT_70866 [Sistotremastrum suecicum HHB10207 ss-3]